MECVGVDLDGTIDERAGRGTAPQRPREPRGDAERADPRGLGRVRDERAQQLEGTLDPGALGSQGGLTEQQAREQLGDLDVLALGDLTSDELVDRLARRLCSLGARGRVVVGGSTDDGPECELQHHAVPEGRTRGEVQEPCQPKHRLRSRFARDQRFDELDRDRSGRPAGRRPRHRARRRRSAGGLPRCSRRSAHRVRGAPRLRRGRRARRSRREPARSPDSRRSSRGDVPTPASRDRSRNPRHRPLDTAHRGRRNPPARHAG